jgi:hypothetical protein
MQAPEPDVDTDDYYFETGLYSFTGPIRLDPAWGMDTDEPPPLTDAQESACIEFLRRRDWAAVELYGIERERQREERMAVFRADRDIGIAARAGDLAGVVKLSGRTSWMPAASNDNKPAGGYPGIISSDDFVRDFVPPDYHIDGVAQAGFIYSLTAQTGTGKTAVSLCLTSATALGSILAGREIRKGRVVYLAGENPDDVRMRWIAQAHHTGFDPASVDVHFVAGTFNIPQSLARLRDDVERLGGADMVVVDTSAAYFQGEDENGNTALGRHAKDLRALTTLPGKPMVLVPCHPVKNADPLNLQPRGGGAFVAEVDGNLVLTKDRGLVKLHWQVKHRGPDFKPLYFELQTVTAPSMVDSKGRLVPTVIAVSPADAAAKIAASFKTKLSLNDAAVLGSLQALCNADGRTSEESWRRAYCGEYPDEKPDTVYRRFKRSKEALIASGEVDNEGHWLFPAGSDKSDGHGHLPDNPDLSDQHPGRTDTDTPLGVSICPALCPKEEEEESTDNPTPADSQRVVNLDSDDDIPLTDDQIPAFLKKSRTPASLATGARP